MGDDDGKIEALAEMICCGGEESVAALLVLVATLENSTRPKELANKVKQFAFNANLIPIEKIEKAITCFAAKK